MSADLNDDGVTYVVDRVSVVGSRTSGRKIGFASKAPISSNASIGQYLRASCVLEQPQTFDGFAYDRFLAAKSIYAICRLSSAPFVISPFRRGVGGLARERSLLAHDRINSRLDQ